MPRDVIGRWAPVAALLVAAVLAMGCGGPCRDVADQRRALNRRSAADTGPHARLRLPIARADELLAATLAEQPIEQEIGPELLPINLPIRLPTLRARVEEIRLVPARPGRVGLATRIQIRDATDEIVTLAVRAEVTPRLAREGAATWLEIGLDADSLRAVEPALGPDATRRLTDALTRWLPDAVRRRLPRPLVERGARELARHLTGAAYRALRATLLARLGEVTRLRIRLPDLPIARATVRSAAAPTGAVEIDLVTDLPVRRGLRPRPAPGPTAPVQLEVSGSAMAEIANWAIRTGRLPTRYTRTLRPRPDGDYRPVFDWVGEGRPRPLRIHIFQERGGCSYFAVGVRPEITLSGGSLIAALRDREIERVEGPTLVEIGAWLKSLVSSAADTTRRLAASTQLEVGGRRFVTRVTRAVLADDELVLDLSISTAGAHERSAAPPVARPSVAHLDDRLAGRCPTGRGLRAHLDR